MPSLSDLITSWQATWTKDAQAVLDYAVDWSLWMADGDYLVSTTFNPSSSDITVVSQTIGNTLSGTTNANAVAWLGGGVAGQQYTVTCHVTTNAGRQDERSFTLNVTNL